MASTSSSDLRDRTAVNLCASLDADGAEIYACDCQDVIPFILMEGVPDYDLDTILPDLSVEDISLVSKLLAANLLKLRKSTFDQARKIAAHSGFRESDGPYF